MREAKETHPNSGMKPEWVVRVEDAEAIAQLRLALNSCERNGGSRPPSSGLLDFLVDRFSGLRIEVFSREHPPPHFRVCADGESANYRISDCAQVSGGLRRYHSEIRRWHVKHKTELIKVWDERRPADCPVGAYREE
jgi:hypothetical protein